MEIWKDIWRPGSYRLNDGRAWTDTAADVRNGFAQGTAMLAAGLAIPSVFDHQSGATPVYLSDLPWDEDSKAKFVRNSAGWVKKYDLRGNVLWALLDIPDPEHAKAVKAARYVSPRLDISPSDSKNREWPGKVVSHVAITNMPVQVDQKPFAATGAGLSGTPATTWKSRETVHLSQLKGNAVDIKALVEALKAKGFTIPDEVTDLAGLVIAIKAGGPGGTVDTPIDTGAGDGDPDGDGFGTADDSTIKPGASAPALMSALPAPVQKMAAGILAGEKKSWLERIESLAKTGRADPQTRARLKTAATGANLSFTGGGNVRKEAWMIQVEAYEALPANSVWSGKPRTGADLSGVPAGSGVRPVERPAAFNAGPTPEEIKEATEFMCTGLPAKK